MKKYYKIFQLTLQEYFVYRLNFILWRFRSFISFLTLLIFWEAVYGSKNLIFGYQKSQMIAYVLGIALLRGIVLSSRSIDMAGQIKSGGLTNVILRPLNIFKFWFSKDLADKLLNIFFTVIEVFLVIKILNIPFYIPQQPITYLLFFLIIILSTFLYFFVSFFISTTTFWTDDTWAGRWLFGIVFLEFLAGTYFPLDILPKSLTTLIYLTPFPYIVYFPIKIWNEQILGFEALKIIGICFVWLFIFYFLSLNLWKKGSKNYGAYGG